jgi:hypothetical protein
LLVDEDLPDDRQQVFVEQITGKLEIDCIRAMAVAELTPARIAFSYARGFLALPRDLVPETILHLARRAELGQRPLLAFAPAATSRRIIVDPLHETVHANGRLLPLTKHQRLIMKRLALTPGKVVSAQELCGFAGIQCSPGYQNLHNELWRLRARLGREMATSIVNVRGRGYRLAPSGNSKSPRK